MNDLANKNPSLPPEQEAIRARCFHPTGQFVEFKHEEIDQSIPERFQKIVRTYPERVAVKTSQAILTYAELNHAANQVAHAILARRGPDREPVALLLPNDGALVVAILGSLKSGKICMPLDPTLPPARISHMVEDAQASALVTNSQYLALSDAVATQRPVINIDELDTDASAENLDLVLAPDDFAYIFYTSGSTGTPKGIVENHRNLLHHIMCETNDFHICAEDRITLFSPAGRDVFRALLNGATLCPLDVKQNGLSEISKRLTAEKITFLTAVVSLYRHILDTLSSTDQFPALRLIKLIGEPVYRRDVELFQKYFSASCVLVNSYGPNETGHLCHYFIDKHLQIKTSTVPVGYAVDDKHVEVLDENGGELSFDTVGEIAVRSIYLSPGYWRRPDLTSAAFFASSEGPVRLYRTGDLGFMQADGRLMHLGRKDSQVKIRGHRVEIAEVEMALLKVEGVKEAVVIAREDGSGLKRLVAYIVPETIPAPNTSALRGRLAATLPDYMIPSTFVSLDKIPLTATGKVDRRVLPEPGRARPELDTPYISARTHVEEEIAEIWAQVLSVDRVGIYDSFFDLGGHSLAASRVISRVIQSFKLNLPLKALLGAPTVVQMAEVIERHEGKSMKNEELERLVREIEAMTEDQAQKQLNGGTDEG